MEDNIYPKVHVIVLNWNNKELTEQCLLSIQRIDYPNYEILIVDNNSSDGSVELFKNNFPDVKLLSLDKNLKYAGGNNAAIDYLSFNEDDFFLFLRLATPSALTRRRKTSAAPERPTRLTTRSAAASPPEKSSTIP